MNNPNRNLENPVAIRHEVPQLNNIHEEIAQDLPEKGESKINISAFYKGELDSFRVSRELQSKNAWHVIENIAAKKVDNSPRDREEDKDTRPRTNTISDKLHRQSLLVYARLEGVKDIDRFGELAEYFESTVVTTQDMVVKVPANMSEAEKKKIITEWETKGWHCRYGVISSFTEPEHLGGKHGGLSLSKEVPLVLNRDHVALIKGLISSDNNPLEIVKKLQNMGFSFQDYILGSSEFMRQMGDMFNAPHIKEAMDQLGGITSRRSNWFTDGEQTGWIEYLTKLASTDDPKAEFPTELVHKIEVLQTALNVSVGAYEIPRFQEIMDNPKYLEFVANLVKQLEVTGNQYLHNTQWFQNIKALESEGLLQPILELQRFGVSPHYSPFQPENSPLLKLFNSFESYIRPKEVRQEVIQSLHKSMDKPEVHQFLDDQQKKEFVGLLSKYRGYPLDLEDLSLVEEYFAKDTELMSKAIYLLKIFGSNDKHPDSFQIDISTLQSLVSSEEIMDTFLQKDFSKFIDTLRSKAGYLPSYTDFFYTDISKDLAFVFNSPEVRQDLMSETTLAVIKAIGGRPDFSNPEFYVSLGNIPNAVRTINALRNLGIDLSTGKTNRLLELLDSFSSNLSTLNKLESQKLKDLKEMFKEVFRVEVGVGELTNLLDISADEELQKQLQSPENISYLTKVGLYSVKDVRPMLELDPQKREILINLIDKYNLHPVFSGFGSSQQISWLDTLSTDTKLCAQLFSKNSQDIFNKLTSDYGYSRLEYNDIRILINTPSNFPEFIHSLQVKYLYSYRRRDLMPLLELAAKKDGFENLLSVLTSHGYTFDFSDLEILKSAIPYTKELSSILSTINQFMPTDFFSQGRIQAEFYKVKSRDLSYLLQLHPFAAKLPETMQMLREVMGYKFAVGDALEIVRVIQAGYTKEQLVGLKKLYDKFKDRYSDQFSIYKLEDAEFLEKNKDTLERLLSYNYRVNVRDKASLLRLIDSPNKDKIFQIMDILREHFDYSYHPDYLKYFEQLAKLPNILEKLRQSMLIVNKTGFMQGENIMLFVAFGADAELYNHAKKLLTDKYFDNVRDAKKRLVNFLDRMYREQIPPEILHKIFSLSSKATEFDNVAHKYTVCAEIASMGADINWQEDFLKAKNSKEAIETLSRVMTQLALPIIYSNLEGDKLLKKQNELLALADKDKEFGEILEITCRSVGIYGQEFPDRDSSFYKLMLAIRKSIELNLERNPQGYLYKRAELSTHQFVRITPDVTGKVGSEVLKTWLDLSRRRVLRVNGSQITTEETTQGRLSRIKDIVNTDLVIHLKELFKTKVKELENTAANTGTKGVEAEQLDIYKRFLLSPDGLVRQDIPAIYLSLQRFMRNSRLKLKSPEVTKEEKMKLSKNLGTYQGISDSLKALYKLGTISEGKLKLKKDYLFDIDRCIIDLSGALKRLKLLDLEKRSSDLSTRSLEEEVIRDIDSLKVTMAEENLAKQTVIETSSTVSFLDLAKAPELTQSCQRLTELTGYNDAAYSRLLDASNEMVDVFETKDGVKVRLARCFVELSKAKLGGDFGHEKLVVLLDRLYVDPEHQGLSQHFADEIILHMIDRVSSTPGISLIFDTERFDISQRVNEILISRGYHTSMVDGEYFINKSNLDHLKYYDSFRGTTPVDKTSWMGFNRFILIQKQ